MATIASYDHYDMPIIESDTTPGDYAIAFTEQIADSAVKQYIEDSLWTFNSDFLASMTDLPEEVFKALRELYEDSNDAILKLVKKICGLDKFVQAAIAADSRGHFLSSYNGEEYDYSDMSEGFQAEIRQLLEDGDLYWSEYDNYMAEMAETNPEYSADTIWKYFKNDYVLGKVCIYRIN